MNKRGEDILKRLARSNEETQKLIVEITQNIMNTKSQIEERKRRIIDESVTEDEG